jgi:CubicO group peptidase (beta-lactamase class C family)
MQKIKFKASALLLTTTLFLATQPTAQTRTKYAKEVEEKITLIENNLVSWVKLDDKKNWNIYARMKESNVNGVSIAVIHNYKIEWVRSYGWADTAEKTPVTNQTLFQPASIGKSINGFAYMKLLPKRAWF